MDHIKNLKVKDIRACRFTILFRSEKSKGGFQKLELAEAVTEFVLEIIGVYLCIGRCSGIYICNKNKDGREAY